MRGIAIFIEIALALLLIFFAYLSIKKYFFETKIESFDYYKYYSFLQSSKDLFSILISNGDLEKIEKISEKVLGTELSIDYIFYVPFSVFNPENKTLVCRTPILYELPTENIKVLGEGYLKTCVYKNWREKLILVNSSKGCFSLNYSFPNLNCTFVYFDEFKVKTGVFNNSLVVCLPFNATNLKLRIFYCDNRSFFEEVKEEIQPNVSASYVEIYDLKSNLTEIVFEAELEPGFNTFYLSFGLGNVPIYKNESLEPNCTLPVFIRSYRIKNFRKSEVKGKRIPVVVPFEKGVAVLYFNIKSS